MRASAHLRSPPSCATSPDQKTTQWLHPKRKRRFKRLIFTIPGTLDFPQMELMVTFGQWSGGRTQRARTRPPDPPSLTARPSPLPLSALLTGVIQNAIKTGFNPLSDNDQGYDWYWIIVASLVLLGAFYFIHHIASELHNGLVGGRGKETPDLKWVEIANFPKGIKGKDRIKYSEATYWDIFWTLVFRRGGTYGEWVAQSDTKYDVKRAAAFKDKFKGAWFVGVSWHAASGPRLPLCIHGCPPPPRHTPTYTRPIRIVPWWEAAVPALPGGCLWQDFADGPPCSFRRLPRGTDPDRIGDRHAEQRDYHPEQPVQLLQEEH